VGREAKLLTPLLLFEMCYRFVQVKWNMTVERYRCVRWPSSLWNRYSQAHAGWFRPYGRWRTTLLLLLEEKTLLHRTTIFTKSSFLFQFPMVFLLPFESITSVARVARTFFLHQLPDWPFALLDTPRSYQIALLREAYYKLSRVEMRSVVTRTTTRYQGKIRLWKS